MDRRPRGNIVTEDKFEKALHLLKGARTIVVDIETLPFGTEEHPKYPPMFSLGTYTRVPSEGGFREAGFYFPFAHDVAKDFPTAYENLPADYANQLRDVLQDGTHTLVGHNFSFDLTSLMKHSGWKWPDYIWYDTMLGMHFINENLNSFRLESLSQLMFDDDGAIKQSNRVHKFAEVYGGLHKLPPEIIGPYTIGDVYRTHRLYSNVRPRMEKESVISLWWPHEADFSLILAEMSDHGILIRPDIASALASEAYEQMQLIRDTLGFDPGKPSSLAPRLFSAPPKGLGLPIGSFSTRNQNPPFVTPDGRWIRKVPNMRQGDLLPYVEESPLVESVLRYRTYQKAYATWFQGWLDLVGSDGRIRPGFKRHGTVTSRLSSEKPNIQQLPRRSDDPAEESKYIKYRVKDMLAAPPGFNLWEFDYKQIEYRLAACIGGDTEVIKRLNAGADFHSITADLLGITRFDAKTFNFATLYGAGTPKLASMLGITEDAAKEIRANFQEQIPGITRAIFSASSKAISQGYIKLWTGRRRHLPDPSDAHKAFNSACQGGAAEIVRYSILKLNKYVPHCPMCAQVHDAVWLEVPHENEEEHLQLIEKTMVEWTGGHFPVIFPVDRKLLAKGPSLVEPIMTAQNS